MASETHPETQLMEPGSGAVPVAELMGEELSYLRLSVLSGQSRLDNLITRPAGAEAGPRLRRLYEYIKPWRVQIIGESETKYLQSAPARLREKRVRDVAAPGTSPASS